MTRRTTPYVLRTLANVTKAADFAKGQISTQPQFAGTYYKGPVKVGADERRTDQNHT